MILEHYFKEHDLFNKEKLLQHAETNLVHVIESKKFPNVVMLHYRDEASYDKQWNVFNRMCRGLIVDLASQTILAYPFDKFFNVGEMPEISYETLVKEGEFEVTEKLDGSMLILFQDPNTNQFFFTTKGSFDSEHGEYATSILPHQLKYEWVVRDYTLMFELISKRFQIVIDYQKKGYEEGVYLIGARRRSSNTLLRYDELKWLGDSLKLKTMKSYKFKTLDDVIEKTKTLPVLEEGYVLLFKETGKQVKIKGEEYLRVHRFLSHMSPKYILEALGEGTANDLIELAPEEYKEDVEVTTNYFKRKKIELVAQANDLFSKAPRDTRKEFAMWAQSSVPSHLKGFLFNLLDNKPLDDRKIYKLIGELENVTGETKL